MPPKLSNTLAKHFLLTRYSRLKEVIRVLPERHRAEIRNPTVELPCDLTTLLNVDALIVTHLHEDHWDETASRVVPKDKQIYVQMSKMLNHCINKDLRILPYLPTRLNLAILLCIKRQGSTAPIAPMQTRLWRSV